MAKIESVNPYNNQLLASYEQYSDEKIKSIIDEVHNSYDIWRSEDFESRSELLKNLSNHLKANKHHYAELISKEMAKPISQSLSEVEKSASVCDYYAENGESFLSDQIVKSGSDDSIISYQPIGIIFAVMPWNFPFWQVFRCLAPNLMAGNVVILKHASNVTGCALAIEKIFSDISAPSNIFRTLIADSTQASSIIANPKISAVTLTGSTNAGKAVAKLAGENLKKSVLELGGSDPYIILKDADLDLAVEKCVTSRMINNGQSCIAAKRFIIESEIYDEFYSKFKAKMAEYKFGDPLDENTKLGPLAGLEHKKTVCEIVNETHSQGAKVEYINDSEMAKNMDSSFYPPTIISNINKNMTAYNQEIFGPVAIMLKAESLDHAIELANDSVFGLGSAIFSSNLDKAKSLAKNKIEAGACFINDFVKSDPKLPFGGIKESGYGRELSEAGIKEFVNIKSISINSNK